MKDLIETAKNQFISTFPTLFCPEILSKLEDCGQRQRSYTPTVLLKGWIFQSLSPAHSCREAVIYLKQFFKLEVSLRTAAYCKARKRLDLNVLINLARSCGQKLAPKEGRILWIDGTILGLSDSKANQILFPQNRSQKKGLGYPILRALCCFCSQSGAFLDMEIGRYSGKGQAEPSLLRKLLNRLRPGDTLVMDRFFTNFYLLANIQNRGMDFVVRMRDEYAKKLMKHSRLLRKGEGVIVWDSSGHRPAYEDERIFKDFCFLIRIVRSRMMRRGYRPKVIYIMSSRIDLAAEEICEIYKKRWCVEVAFRDLKTTMGMEVLKGKNPDMALKELWVGMIAYNIIMAIVGHAVLALGSMGIKVSFKTAIGLFTSKLSALSLKDIEGILKALMTTSFRSKYRREPRAVKRRSRRYPDLTTTRKLSIKRHWGYRRIGQKNAA